MWKLAKTNRGKMFLEKKEKKRKKKRITFICAIWVIPGIFTGDCDRESL